VYTTRNLILVVPAVLLLIALGVLGLGRWGRVAGLLALAAVLATDLLGYYKARPREDWRAVARHIETRWREGDCVVICASYCAGPFNYYCRVDPTVLPRYEVDRDMASAQVHSHLAARLAGRSRVWLVLAHTGRPRGVTTPVEDALAGMGWVDVASETLQARGVRAQLTQRRSPD
jgi:hypothetical protein